MTTKSLWRSANYRFWFASDTSDVLALNLRMFAIPLIALALSGSSFVSGLVVSLGEAVTAVCTIFGGVLTDRHDRRRMMIMLGIFGTALSIATVALMALGAMTAPMFAVIVVLYAINSGLLSPANNAILKSLIPIDQFAKAQATREARESAVGMVSGAVSGFLYRLFAWVPFLVAGVMHLISAVAALPLPGGKPATGGSPETTDGSDGTGKAGGDVSFWMSLRQGIVWASGKRRFIAYTAHAAVGNISCIGIYLGTQLMLAANGTDPFLIGLIDTGSGIMMFLGALCATRIADRIPAGTICIINSLVFITCMTPMLFTANYAIILISLSLAAFLFPSQTSSMLGYIYGSTPEDMQGRADALLETVAVIFSALTPALIGWMLQTAVGFRGVTVLCIICETISLLIVAVTPLRTVPTPDRWSETEL